MSSKKILAASMAAILATGTIAAVASAENTDYEWTISGEGLGAEVYVDPVDLKVKTSVSGTSLNALFGDTTTGSKAGADIDGKDETKNKYNKVHLGIWEAFDDFDITAFRSGTITATVAGKGIEYTNELFVTKSSQGGEVTYATLASKAYLPKLKDGAQLIVQLDSAGDGDSYDPTEEDDYTAGTSIFMITGVLKDGKATDLATPVKLHKSASADTKIADAWAALKAMDAAALFADTDMELFDGNVDTYSTTKLPTTAAEAAGEVDVTATASKAITPAWKDVKSAKTGGGLTGFPVFGGDNADKLGKATDPVELELAFGTGDALKLTKLDNTKSSVEVELDITVSGDTFGTYVAEQYAVNGAPGKWDFKTGTFNASAGSFQADIPIDDAGNLSNQFGLVLVGNYVGASSGINVVLPANLAEDPGATPKKGDLQIADNGFAVVDFAKLISPAVMKNLNNGGTVTFKFDKSFSLAGWKHGYVMYFNGAKTIPLASDFGYNVSGNEITFTIPEGLTYDDGSLNSFKPFILQWKFENNEIDSGSIWAPGNTPDDDGYDGKIVAITFKANGAPDAPSVGDGENSGNNGGNTSNPGSTSGNPNTGIALAVAPIVLAAGAVVTIASKKRK